MTSDRMISPIHFYLCIFLINNYQAFTFYLNYKAIIYIISYVESISGAQKGDTFQFPL